MQQRRSYMDRVSEMGCLVCRLMGLGATPAELHHIRAGVGKAQRAGDYCVIPLCPEHHRGKTGVHSGVPQRMLKMSELDMLDLTIGQVFGEIRH